MMIYCTLLIVYVAFHSVTNVQAWSNDQKVKLIDIQTLTLHNGKMTTGKRSAPVPQVYCTGGTAGCNAFVPKVVQCYNKGSDGTDVQWECKTDMDNAYRFGQVDVICEGYDYPDDPYILKGSCGLEYTLEVTEEGQKKQGGQQYGGNYGYSQSSYSDMKNSHKSTFADLLFYVIIILFMYGIYRTCLRRQQYSPTGDDYDSPDDGSRMGFGGYPAGGQPPPPGFRPGFTPGYTDEGCSAGARRAGQAGGAPGFGGFWSGAAAGSMLGYMFGNRNTGRGQSSFFAPSTGNSGWGGSSSFSSGTRTASGFGGTRRR